MNKAPTVEDQIIVALRRITRAIDLHSRVLLQGFGLTAPQLGTLRVVSRLQPISARRLAEEIHASGPTLTGILDRLERRGLIRRIRAAADRRSLHISMTDEGTRILGTAPSLLQEQFRGELMRLPPDERTHMLATLERIATMMQTAPLEAAAVAATTVNTTPLETTAIEG